MLSTFCSPSRYTQGRGATSALGREMKALGLEGPALIIAGKTVIGRLASTWKSSLDEAKIHHEVHRFTGECSTVEIERVKAAACQYRARTIIGAAVVKSLIPRVHLPPTWDCRWSIALPLPPVTLRAAPFP